MALRQEHRTKTDDRVRIKDSVTHMYPMARAYSEGFVRARMHDPHGYPLVFVEWDRDHWAYSGEQDRWVLEAHFDLVEDKMAEDKNEKFIKSLGELFKQWEADGAPQGGDHADSVAEEPKSRSSQDLTYEEVLNLAVQDAKEGDAFIVLVAHPDEFNGTEFVIPHIYSHAHREDASMMLEGTMADAAAQAHARLVTRLINEAQQRAEDERST